MESGDIIYFILLVFFMILGFFNDSRKKKKQKQAEAQRRAEAQQLPEVDFHPLLDEEEEPIFQQPRNTKHNSLPPPLPASYSAKERYDNFQSSLDLVSIHQEPSTLSSYIFDYDANSFYEIDLDSPALPETAREDKSGKLSHPLLQDLRSDMGREELKKGLIYGEIMQRKY